MKMYQSIGVAGASLLLAGCCAISASTAKVDGELKTETVNIFALPKEIAKYCLPCRVSWNEQEYQFIRIDLNHDGEEEILFRVKPIAITNSSWLILQKSFKGEYCVIGNIGTPLGVRRSDKLQWDILVAHGLDSDYQFYFDENKMNLNLYLNGDTHYESFCSASEQDKASPDEVRAELYREMEQCFQDAEQFHSKLFLNREDLKPFVTSEIKALDKMKQQKRQECIATELNLAASALQSWNCYPLQNLMYLEKIAEYLAGTRAQNVREVYELLLKVQYNSFPRNGTSYMAILEKYADYLWDVKDTEQAEKNYLEVLHYCIEQMAAEDGLRSRAALVQSKLSKLYCDAGKPESAMQYAQDAIALMERHDESKLKAEERTALGAAYGARGYCLAHQGNDPMADFDRAIKLFEGFPGLNNADGDNAFWIPFCNGFSKETIYEYSVVKANRALHLLARKEQENTASELYEAYNLQHWLAQFDKFYMARYVDLIFKGLDFWDQSNSDMNKTMTRDVVEMLRNHIELDKEWEQKLQNWVCYSDENNYEMLKVIRAVTKEYDCPNCIYAQLIEMLYYTQMLQEDKNEEAIAYFKDCIFEKQPESDESYRLIQIISMRLCGEGLMKNDRKLEAIAYLKAALELAEKETDNETMIAKIRQSLEALREHLNDFEKEEPGLGEKLFKAEREYRRNENVEDYRKVLIRIADFYRKNAREEVSEWYIETLSNMYKYSSCDEITTLQYRVKMGNILYSIMDFAGAIEVYQEGLYLQTVKPNGRWHMYRAEAYYGLAKIYNFLEYKHLEEMCYRSSAMEFVNYLKEFSGSPEELKGGYLAAARSLYQLAELLEANERGDESEKWVALAMELQERDPAKAEAVAERAQVRTWLGWKRCQTQPEAAQTLFTEALALLHGLQGEEAKANELLLAKTLAGRSLSEPESEASKAFATQANAILAAYPDNADAAKIKRRWESVIAETK